VMCGEYGSGCSISVDPFFWSRRRHSMSDTCKALLGEELQNRRRFRLQDASVPVASEKPGQRPFRFAQSTEVVLPDSLDGQPPTVIERPSLMGGVAPSERNSGAVEVTVYCLCT
jgi:hypothetical protein